MSNGSCLCGNVTFRWSDDIENGIWCSCANCRKSGSIGTLNLLGDEKNLEITKGKPKRYIDNESKSGKPVYREFCGDCGSPLWSIATAMPGKIFVKPGTLDDVSKIKTSKRFFDERCVCRETA